ncbi:MAG: YihY/virulence factor BrkB family protein [Nitrospirota bacterium]
MNLPVVSEVWLVLREAVRRFLSVNGLFLASALAFSLLLYSVPLVLLVVAALGQTVVESDRALAEIQAILRQILPDIEQTAVEGLATAAAHRRALGLYGLVLFALFSTTTFGTARFALNVLFGVERRRGFFRGMGVDALMIVLLAALFAATIALNSALGAARAAGDSVPFVGPILRSDWFIASELLGTLFILALCYLVYRVCPARSLRPRGLVVAALTTTVLLEIFRWAFGWYAASVRHMTVLYGAIGGLVLFILWLYYSAAVFFFGAAVGWAVDRRPPVRASSLNDQFR